MYCHARPPLRFLLHSEGGYQTDVLLDLLPFLDVALVAVRRGLIVEPIQHALVFLVDFVQVRSSGGTTAHHDILVSVPLDFLLQ